jgi:hypothetical protein
MISTLSLRFTQIFERIYKSHLEGCTLQLHFSPARDEKKRGFDTSYENHLEGT